MGALEPNTRLFELRLKPESTGVTKLTVKLTVLVVVATELLTSLTAKTIFDAANAPDGVPDTAPVDELRDRPAGSVPELM